MNQDYINSSPYSVLILSFAAGALLLSIFSIFQKILIGADPFVIYGFIVPVLFGGISGLLIGLWYNRFKTTLGTLKEKHAQLLREQAEKQHLQEELYQSQKMEAIGHLTGGIAHDFNNLMMVINGSCELAAGRLTLEEQNRSRIPIIWEAGKRATSLTQQLLAFSRRQVIQPKWINPGQSIYEFLELLKRMVGESIRLELKDHAEEYMIYIDPGQIEQIIINLVVNARDAMPGGGIISIALTPGGQVLSSVNSSPPAGTEDQVILSITDTGCGMSPEIQEHIFEPFFSTKPRDKGTGLGLSTVYGIVMQHKGSISVRSEPDKGSTFYLKFPAKRESSPRINRGDSQVKNIPVNAKIMLVEDNEQVRLIVAEILRNAGCVVHEPATLASALQLCADTTADIDLLITDVIMPDISGLEFSDSCRKLKSNLRTLFISGYPDKMVDTDGILGNHVFFLQKPFNELDLLNRVAAILSAK